MDINKENQNTLLRRSCSTVFLCTKALEKPESTKTETYPPSTVTIANNPKEEGSISLVKRIETIMFKAWVRIPPKKLCINPEKNFDLKLFIQGRHKISRFS